MKRVSNFRVICWSAIASESVFIVAAACLAAVLATGCQKKEVTAPPPTVEVVTVD